MLIVSICGGRYPRKIINDVYYLPGDIKRILYPYDVQQVSKAWESIRELIKNLSIAIQPVVSNIIAQYKEMAMRFEEQIQKEKVIGLAKLDTPSDMTMQEFINSMKKEFKEFRHDNDPLPRPTKIIKAAKVNKHVNKIIYHHIRSNC